MAGPGTGMAGSGTGLADSEIVNLGASTSENSQESLGKGGFLGVEASVEDTQDCGDIRRRGENAGWIRGLEPGLWSQVDKSDIEHCRGSFPRSSENVRENLWANLRDRSLNRSGLIKLHCTL